MLALPTRAALVTLLAWSAATATLAGVARAQVPEGSAVIATYNNGLGTPGLFILSLATGTVTPITGLPAELVFNNGARFEGAWSVSIRSSDGAVIVGGVSQSGVPMGGSPPLITAVNLFVLHLGGAAVRHCQKIYLGRGTGRKSAWHVVLPDGRILVAAARGSQPLPQGPMAGRFLAIVDTESPTPIVTLLPNPAIPVGLLGGLALDATAKFCYFVHSVPPSPVPTAPPAQATLSRIDLATSTVCSIVTWPGENAFGLACDDDGTIYVNSTDAVTWVHRVHAVRLSGCSAATVMSAQSATSLLSWGLDLDRERGLLVATSGTTTAVYSGVQNSVSLVDPISGTIALTWPPPAGGWGEIGIQGVAVNNRIESYGAASDGQDHYWFDNFPNPGGQPTVGNSTFSLTVASTQNVALLSMVALSFGRSSVPMFGAEVLVDLSSAAVMPIPTGVSVPVSLPIPNDPSLAGLVLTAQSLHLEPGGIVASSRGLTLTVQ